MYSIISKAVKNIYDFINAIASLKWFIKSYIFFSIIGMI